MKKLLLEDVLYILQMILVIFLLKYYLDGKCFKLALYTSFIWSLDVWFNFLIIYCYLDLKKVNFVFSSVPKIRWMRTGIESLIIWFSFYIFLPYEIFLIPLYLLLFPFILLIFDAIRFLIKRLFKW